MARSSVPGCSVRAGDAAFIYRRARECGDAHECGEEDRVLPLLPVKLRDPCSRPSMGVACAHHLQKKSSPYRPDPSGAARRVLDRSSAHANGQRLQLQLQSGGAAS